MRRLLVLIASLAPIVTARGALTAVESTTHVGPNTTVTVDFVTTYIDIPLDPPIIIADFDTYSFEVDDSANHALPGSVKPEDTIFGESRMFFRESEAPDVPDPALAGNGVVTPSTMFIASVGAPFYQVSRVGAITGFLNGAQLGTDNWVYFSNNNNPGTEQPSFWTQFELTETTATPIRYVHNPSDPYGDITMVEALSAANAIPEPKSALLVCLVGIAFAARRRR